MVEPVRKNIRILVVDDYLLTREMVRTILKSLGFQNTITADNGQMALQILERELIEFVICDWNMPSMSGIELLRALRNLDQYKSTPFLMLTAEAYRENVLEALQAGVSGYVAKPFTSEILENKIHEILGKIN